MATARRLRAVDSEDYLHREKIAQYAEELPEEYRQCRDEGHARPLRPVDAVMNSDGTRERWRECPRCGTVFHQILFNGRIIGGKGPKYPPGYLREAGAGRLDAEGRAVFRDMGFEREYQMLHPPQAKKKRRTKRNGR